MVQIGHLVRLDSAMADLGKFIHLHCHSMYSLLDGANRFDSLCTRVKELGMGAIALTDHGNLFGAYQFQKTCLKHEVKPILGCEIYVSPGGRRDRTSTEAKRNQHFVLLAETDEGYANLSRLTSLAHIEGFYYKPRIDKEILAQNSRGLIATSACLKGVVADYLLRDDFPAAQKSIDDYVQILGRGNFYMELMDHGIDVQKRVNDGIIELAKKNDLPLIATNDCHYLRESDHTMHDVLLCIQTGKTVNEEKRLRYVNQFYMKTPDDMIAKFGHLNGAIGNTIEIAERCNGKIATGQKLLPKFHPPDGKTEGGYLRELALAGLEKRYGGRALAAHRERLDFELGVIEQMGFASYFLIVWDFIAYAKNRGIPVGPGRGSGAGSLVAYSLEITDLCPLEHGLFFERFLNPERVSMPDFDIDFCFERRSEVIEYVKQKYGERNVAQIITFTSMKAKAAVRDVGRVMGMSLQDVDKIAKMIPDGPKVDLVTTLEESEELRKLVASDDAVRRLVETAKEIEGFVRNTSVHAAGVVIADQDLSNLIPLYVAAGTTDLVTQYTMTEVEEIGLLKMDFLGLKTLTFIDKIIKELKRARGIEVDWAKIPLDEPATYKLLQTGEAFGLFQLESSGMRDLLKQLKPEKFSDVVALISLYRPGPMENIPECIARKHGRKPITYDHPNLEPILKETYGLIVYQEQVMQIVQVLAGFSLGQADILRRAMGKKKAEEMAKQRKGFVEGCAKTVGMGAAQADEIFALIEKFAGYGFNKSHSAAYTMVTFQTAYLKAHYPVEFMAELLTMEIGGNDEKMSAYFAAANAMGIEILPPDINESRVTFTVVGKNIRFGLLGIKNVGEAAVKAVIEERDKNGPFISIQDFVSRLPSRMLNSRVVECLIKCGVFDSFGDNRPSLLRAMPRVMEHAGLSRKEAGELQSSLFEIMSEEDQAGLRGAARIEFVEDWPEGEKLEYEKALAGYYLSGHPLKRYKADYELFATTTSSRLKQMRKDEQVAWMGLIRSATIRMQKTDGRPFAIVTCEDAEGTLEATFFADAFAQYREVLRDGAVVWISGSVNHWNDRVTIRAKEAMSADEIRKKRVKGLRLHLSDTAINEANLTRLTEIMTRHKGRCPVRIFVEGESGVVAVNASSQFSITPTDHFLQELREAKFEKRWSYVTNGA